MDGPEFRSPPKRIILGDLNQNGGSPVSPMANLKLLTKVATSRFSAGESKEYSDTQLEKRDLKSDKPSRRSRSLSCICKKFLHLYKLDIPVGESRQISLGNLALSLGIEKRRVYDIINVVSSLHMAVKVCKDKYNWFGNQNLPLILSKLKAYALVNKFDEQINNVLQNQLFVNDFAAKQADYSFIKIPHGNRSVFEANRIGVLCQKFIMLFLACNPDIPLNMCTISKLILSSDVQDKTGMRRLYDIVNVLEALDLIKRYHCKIMKKPSFIYCGPLIDLDHSDYERLMPKDVLWLNQMTEIISENGDTNSDSSLDFTHTTSTKLDSILEVVCTEFEEENKKPPIASSTPLQDSSAKKKNFDYNTIQCNAKKQLFPTAPNFLNSITTTTISNGFIKAPKRSFSLGGINDLQVKELSEFNDTKKPTIVKKVSTSPNQQLQTINFKANFNSYGRLESVRSPTQNDNGQNMEIFKHLQNTVVSFTPSSSANENNNKAIFNLNNIPSIEAKKIKILRPIKLAEIQNGGVYKALKKGNSVQFYPL